MSVGAVNKQTGKRIQTAGMPAIDSVLSGSSTNPVQNRVVKAALGEKADTDIVASDFSTSASYTAGDYCIYEGKFYKFKANHSGAWSAADVDEIKIAGELSSLMSGLTNVNSKLTITEPLTGISGIFADKMGNMVTLHFAMDSITATSLGWYILADKLPAGLRPHRLVYFTGYDNDDSTHESSGAMQCMIDADGTVKIYAMSDNLTFALRGTISYISD